MLLLLGPELFKLFTSLSTLILEKFLSFLCNEALQVSYFRRVSSKNVYSPKIRTLNLFTSLIIYSFKGKWDKILQMLVQYAIE